MQYPKFIQKKETIGICAPSAGVGKKLDVYLTSIKRLQQDFTIIETKSVRNNNLRSTDAKTRAKELEELYLNEDVKLVLCASGGNFLFEILPYIDWNLLTSHPKWIMGYSDPTSLLYILTTKYDIATFYGCNGSTYDANHEFVAKNIEILQGNLLPQHSYEYYQKTEDFLQNIDEYHGQVKWILSQPKIQVTGRCIGGCLEVLQNLFGTNYDATQAFIERYQNDGIIWYFDIFNMSAETVYLTLLQMKYANYFKYTKAILVGRICFESTETGMNYLDALAMAIPDIPFIYNADIGHTNPKMTMINGALLTLNAKDHLKEIRFQCK